MGRAVRALIGVPPVGRSIPTTSSNPARSRIVASMADAHVEKTVLPKRRNARQSPLYTPVKGSDTMKATRTLHDQGQRLWLDNITLDLL
jgi:hypothetical protein